MLHDLIELLPLFSTLEPVHTADSHQALQTSVNGIRITGSQQLKCDIQETWPLLGKVMLKNFLQERDELGANIRGRRCEGRNQPFPERRFLLIRNRCLQRAVFDGSPTPVDAVFEVNAGYRVRTTSVRPYHPCFPKTFQRTEGHKSKQTYQTAAQRLSAPPARYPKVH